MPFILFIGSILFFSNAFAKQPTFTVLDSKQYFHVVSFSRQKVKTILEKKTATVYQSADDHLHFLIEQLIDAPYLFEGAMGEGDWQPNALSYRGGAIHINQQPVYRLDGFDCQTLVQVVMALYYAKNINEFDTNLIKIAYGALDNTLNDRIHFYNRNHFVDEDFNKVNQLNGWLLDITDKHKAAKYTSAMISREGFFVMKQHQLAKTIQVLDARNAKQMRNRFTNFHASFASSAWEPKKVAIAYIPKEKIALRLPNGTFKPNQSLLDGIPTPAIAELVYDTKKWQIAGKNIKAIIGTELNISHFGFVYRQRFFKDDIIYHKINCDDDNQHFTKICHVTPIRCKEKICHELMFAHATNAYPKGYYWYQNTNGDYVCSPKPPSKKQIYTSCNRVMQKPLFDYLTDYQYGSYWYMDWPVMLGLHFEKLIQGDTERV